jgi:hypothetical protein
MAYVGTQQIVIDSVTKEVKRVGFCDMEGDGALDAGSETVISNDFVFDPPIDEKIWTWNGSTFIEGAAVSEDEGSQMIQQIDVNKDSKNSSYKTLSRVIFLGTSKVGSILQIEGIAYMDSAVTSYDCRVIDRTHGSAVIAEVTGLSNETDAIIDFGTISNLPETKSALDIQIKKTGGGGSAKVYLDSILIKY